MTAYISIDRYPRDNRPEAARLIKKLKQTVIPLESLDIEYYTCGSHHMSVKPFTKIDDKTSIETRFLLPLKDVVENIELTGPVTGDFSEGKK